MKLKFMNKIISLYVVTVPSSCTDKLQPLYLSDNSFISLGAKNVKEELEAGVYGGPEGPLCIIKLDIFHYQLRFSHYHFTCTIEYNMIERDITM